MLLRARRLLEAFKNRLTHVTGVESIRRTRVLVQSCLSVRCRIQKLEVLTFFKRWDLPPWAHKRNDISDSKKAHRSPLLPAAVTVLDTTNAAIEKNLTTSSGVCC